MRKQRVVLSLLAGVLITAFTTGAAVAAPTILDRLVAFVNSSIILKSDITRFRQTLKLRTQLDPLFSGTTVAAKGEQASDQEIADFLIDEKIISQTYPVSDSEVEQEINSIQANNKIDRATLRRALQDQGFSFEEYFDLIRSSTSKRNLIDRDIRSKVTISDDDIKNYFYNQYTRSSEASVSYHIALISVSIANYKTPAAAREIAQNALAAVRAGEPFEDVARRISDHSTATAGGDLGSFSEEGMSAQFLEQVKKLKIGGVSDIFGGPATGSFNILRLVDLKSDDSERFEKMKNEIRNQLTAAEYQHQIALWLDRQRQVAFIHRSGESSAASLPTAAKP